MENEIIEKTVYNPEDIQAILGIGKNKLYKVPIKSFDSWLNEE